MDNNELYNYIYNLVLSYLPCIASVLTCILTFVKLINAVKANKADNAMLGDQIDNMKHTCELMSQENIKMAQENRELKKLVQKVLDKTEV